MEHPIPTFEHFQDMSVVKDALFSQGKISSSSHVQGEVVGDPDVSAIILQRAHTHHVVNRHIRAAGSPFQLT